MIKILLFLLETMVLLKFRLLNFVTFIFFYSRGDYDLLYLAYKVKYACSLSDMDECRVGHDIKMNECHPNASCINTQGSYHCFCNPTYVGNSFECKGMFSFLQTFKLVKAALKLICCFPGGHGRPTQIQVLLN